MTVTEITNLLYEATRRKVVMIHRPHKTTSVTTAAIERIPFGGDVVNIDEFGRLHLVQGQSKTTILLVIALVMATVKALVIALAMARMMFTTEILEISV